MKRSHRLLREVHGRRLERLGEARGRGPYDAFAEVDAFGRVLGLLSAEGHFDREPLGDPIEHLAHRMSHLLVEVLKPGRIADQAASRIAQVVLAERRSATGSYRVLPSDRGPAKRCSALAEAAVLDRFYRAVATVLRQRAATDHRDRACWPTSSPRAEDGTQSSPRAEERRIEAAETAV